MYNVIIIKNGVVSMSETKLPAWHQEIVDFAKRRPYIKTDAAHGREFDLFDPQQAVTALAENGATAEHIQEVESRVYKNRALLGKQNGLAKPVFPSSALKPRTIEDVSISYDDDGRTVISFPIGEDKTASIAAGRGISEGFQGGIRTAEFTEAAWQKEQAFIISNDRTGDMYSTHMLPEKASALKDITTDIARDKFALYTLRSEQEMTAKMLVDARDAGFRPDADKYPVAAKRFEETVSEPSADRVQAPKYQYINMVRADMVTERNGPGGSKFYTARVTVPKGSISAAPDADFVSVKMQDMSQIRTLDGEPAKAIGKGAPGNVNLRFYADKPVPVNVKTDTGWQRVDDMYGRTADGPVRGTDLNELHRADVKARSEANKGRIAEAASKAEAVTDNVPDKQAGADFA